MKWDECVWEPCAVSYHAGFFRLRCKLSAEVFSMDKRTKRKIRQDDLERFLTVPGDYPDRTSTVSATETTGLIPAPPGTSEQYSAYQTLAGMQVPAKESTDDRA